MQADDLAQDYLIRRMVIHGLTARNRLVEAQAQLQNWMTDLTGLQDKLADRSEDRRSSMAPRRNRLQGMR